MEPIIELGLGLVFCFLGYPIARFALGLGGAAIGFGVGTAAHAQLATAAPAVPSWLLPVVVAVIFAWLAYRFFWAGVLVLMGLFGWALGQTISTLIGVDATLTAVISIGTAVALVGIGFAFNVPRKLVIVVTALLGAGGIVSGAKALLGTSLSWLTAPLAIGGTSLPASWTIVYVGVAVLGILSQSRAKSSPALAQAYR